MTDDSISKVLIQGKPPVAKCEQVLEEIENLAHLMEEEGARKIIKLKANALEHMHVLVLSAMFYRNMT